MEYYLLAYSFRHTVDELYDAIFVMFSSPKRSDHYPYCWQAVIGGAVNNLGS